MYKKRELAIQIALEIILGLLFIIFPTSFQKFIIYVLSALLLAFGVFKIINAQKLNYSDQFLISSGILNIVIALAIILLNNFIVSLIPILFAIALLLKGITKIILNYLNKEINPLWIGHIINGSIMVILGFIIIIYSKSSDIIGYLIGSFILFNALVDGFTIYNIYKYPNSSNINFDHNSKKYNEDNIIDVTFTEKKDDDK